MPTGASRIPSSCRLRRWRALSASSCWACASRARSAMTAALARSCGSVTTTKRHGWECPTLGAACPAASSSPMMSSPTGSGRNRRISLRAAMISARATRAAAGNAQPIGSAARSALLLSSPISGRGRGQDGRSPVLNTHRRCRPLWPGRNDRRRSPARQSRHQHQQWPAAQSSSSSRRWPWSVASVSLLSSGRRHAGVRAAGMPGRSQAAQRARQPCRLPIVVSRDPIPCPGARARPGQHATARPGAAWPLTAASPAPLVTATLALGSSALLIARAIGRKAQRKAERRRRPGSTQRRGAPDRRGHVASSSSSRAT